MLVNMGSARVRGADRSLLAWPLDVGFVQLVTTVGPRPPSCCGWFSCISPLLLCDAGAAAGQEQHMDAPCNSIPRAPWAALAECVCLRARAVVWASSSAQLCVLVPTKAPLCWWHRAPGLGRCAGLDFWLTMRKLMHFLSGSDLGILDTGRGQVGGRMGRAADVSRNGEMSAEEECTATKIQSEGCGREQGMERVAPG